MIDGNLVHRLSSEQTGVKETVEKTNSTELFSNKESILDKKQIEATDFQNIEVTGEENVKTKSSVTDNKIIRTLEEQQTIYEKIKSYIEWSSIEELYNSNYSCFRDQKVDINFIPTTTFTKALEEKLRASLIGCFLEHLNNTQSKDHETYKAKTELAEFLFNQNEDPMKDRKNDVCKDIIDVIKKAVETGRVINTDVLYSCMWNVRLADCMVSQ